MTEEGCDGFCGNPLRRASPSRVDGPHGARFRIHDQKGDAIGCQDGEDHLRQPGHNGVCFDGSRRRASRLKESDLTRMSLTQADDRKAIHPQGLEEGHPIGFHSLPRVGISEPEIKRARRKNTSAAQPG